MLLIWAVGVRKCDLVLREGPSSPGTCLLKTRQLIFAHPWCEVNLVPESRHNSVCGWPLSCWTWPSSPCAAAVQQSSHQQHDEFTSCLHGMLLQNYAQPNFFLFSLENWLFSPHLTVLPPHFSLASCTLCQQCLLFIAGGIWQLLVSFPEHPWHFCLNLRSRGALGWHPWCAVVTCAPSLLLLVYSGDKIPAWGQLQWVLGGKNHRSSVFTLVCGQKSGLGATLSDVVLFLVLCTLSIFLQGILRGAGSAFWRGSGHRGEPSSGTALSHLGWSRKFSHLRALWIRRIPLLGGEGFVRLNYTQQG